MKILYELSKDQFTVMKGLVDILFLVTCITKVRSSDLPLNFVGDFIANLGITDLTFVFGDCPHFFTFFIFHYVFWKYLLTEFLKSFENTGHK